MKKLVASLIIGLAFSAAQAADIFSEGLIVIIGDVLMVIVIIAVMLYRDVALTIIVLLPLPLLIVATSIFQKAIKSAFQQIRTEVSNLNTYLQEHITR